MWVDTACDSLRRRRVLAIRYDGYTRAVEVHAVCYSKPDHAILRAWQISGGSVSGERSGWKLMRLDEASGAHVSDTPSQDPRPGYKRGDAATYRIVCEM